MLLRFSRHVAIRLQALSLESSSFSTEESDPSDLRLDHALSNEQDWHDVLWRLALFLVPLWKYSISVLQAGQRLVHMIGFLGTRGIRSSLSTEKG